MYTWHTLALAVAALIAFSLFINEARLRQRDGQRIELLQRRLTAHKCFIESLCADKAALELELRTRQQTYIFDLPAHIPGSRYYYPN